MTRKGKKIEENFDGNTASFIQSSHFFHRRRWRRLRFFSLSLEIFDRKCRVIFSRSPKEGDDTWMIFVFSIAISSNRTNVKQSTPDLRAIITTKLSKKHKGDIKKFCLTNNCFAGIKHIFFIWTCKKSVRTNKHQEHTFTSIHTYTVMHLYKSRRCTPNEPTNEHYQRTHE